MLPSLMSVRKKVPYQAQSWDTMEKSSVSTVQDSDPEHQYSYGKAFGPKKGSNWIFFKNKT